MRYSGCCGRCGRQYPSTPGHPVAFELYFQPVQFQARGHDQHSVFPTSLVRLVHALPGEYTISNQSIPYTDSFLNPPPDDKKSLLSSL